MSTLFPEGIGSEGPDSQRFWTGDGLLPRSTKRPAPPPRSEKGQGESMADAYYEGNTKIVGGGESKAAQDDATVDVVGLGDRGSIEHDSLAADLSALTEDFGDNVLHIESAAESLYKCSRMMAFYYLSTLASLKPNEALDETFGGLGEEMLRTIAEDKEVSTIKLNEQSEALVNTYLSIFNKNNLRKWADPITGTDVFLSDLASLKAGAQAYKDTLWEDQSIFSNAYKVLERFYLTLPLEEEKGKITTRTKTDAIKVLRQPWESFIGFVALKSHANSSEPDKKPLGEMKKFMNYCGFDQQFEDYIDPLLEHRFPQIYLLVKKENKSLFETYLAKIIIHAFSIIITIESLEFDVAKENSNHHLFLFFVESLGEFMSGYERLLQILTSTEKLLDKPSFDRPQDILNKMNGAKSICALLGLSSKEVERKFLEIEKFIKENKKLEAKSKLSELLNMFKLSQNEDSLLYGIGQLFRSFTNEEGKKSSPLQDKFSVLNACVNDVFGAMQVQMGQKFNGGSTIAPPSFDVTETRESQSYFINLAKSWLSIVVLRRKTYKYMDQLDKEIFNAAELQDIVKIIDHVIAADANNQPENPNGLKLKGIYPDIINGLLGFKDSLKGYVNATSDATSFRTLRQDISNLNTYVSNISWQNFLVLPSQQQNVTDRFSDLLPKIFPLIKKGNSEPPSQIPASDSFREFATVRDWLLMYEPQASDRKNKFSVAEERLIAWEKDPSADNKGALSHALSNLLEGPDPKVSTGQLQYEEIF